MKVIISATLRSFFLRNGEAEVNGKTVSEVLENLVRKFPEAKEGLFEEDGKVRSFIRIFSGERDVPDPAFHG